MKYKADFIDKDLRNLPLQGSDFSDTLFYNCNLRGNDLSNANLTGSSFPGSDLHGVKLFNTKISLNCLTFKGAKLDENTVHFFLYLLTLLDTNPELIKQIKGIIGESRYQLIKNLLSRWEE